MGLDKLSRENLESVKLVNRQIQHDTLRYECGSGYGENKGYYKERINKSY